MTTWQPSGNVMKKLGTVTLNQQFVAVDGVVYSMTTTYQILQSCILPVIWGMHMVAAIEALLDINNRGKPEMLMVRNLPGFKGKVIKLPLFASSL